MPSRIRSYLDEHHIKYITITHSQAFTAQEVAQAAHVRGKEMAKAVIVKADDRFIMAVLPAHHKINLMQLQEMVGARHVRLATEAEFQDLFPDCEIGAMPIFGNLYDLPVYVAEPLTSDVHIVFNAGTHTVALEMYMKDFMHLVQPAVARFSAPA